MQSRRHSVANDRFVGKRLLCMSPRAWMYTSFLYVFHQARATSFLYVCRKVRDCTRHPYVLVNWTIFSDAHNSLRMPTHAFDTETYIVVLVYNYNKPFPCQAIEYVNFFPQGAEHAAESCWPEPLFSATTDFILGMLVLEWKISSWGIWICNNFIDQGKLT